LRGFAAALLYEEFAAQYFSYTPRLSHAASRDERGLCVEYFTDGVNTVFMLFESPEEGLKRARVVRVRTAPCIAEGADESRPDGSLVVCGIARPQIAIIFRFIVLVVAGKGAKVPLASTIHF
jgi:hypothetical protein